MPPELMLMVWKWITTLTFCEIADLALLFTLYNFIKLHKRGWKFIIQNIEADEGEEENARTFD